MSPFSSPWVAWVMLGLAICAILAGVFQPAVIRQGFVSLFSKVERSYNDSPMNYIGQVLLFVFRAGIVGMAIYLFTYNSDLATQANGGDFLFSRYMTIMGAVAAMEVVKYLVSLLLNYTFQLSRQFATLFTHYTYVSTSICCVLYPLLLLIIYFGNQALTTIGLCIMMGLCWLVLFIKWVRVFFTDIASVVYVVLYILTIEVLPLLTLTYIFS
ncbi:MAG: DUF4271 domain-containing protein [Paludibacteraceae bacterium]